jgi:DNA ligase (NAD+)
LLTSPPDIFRLKEGEIQELERFGDVSARKLVKEIQAKKNIELSRFVMALGIPNVGEQTAIDLAHAFRSLSRLIHATKEELLAVSDIGEVVASSIRQFFASDQAKRWLKDYEGLGIKIHAPKQQGASLAGQIFVLTGTLTSLSREEAKEKIRALGGDVSASVSSKTQFVVAGEKPGSKFDQAQKLNVRILSEREFLAMVGSSL